MSVPDAHLIKHWNFDGNMKGTVIIPASDNPNSVYIEKDQESILFRTLKRKKEGKTSKSQKSKN